MNRPWIKLPLMFDPARLRSDIGAISSAAWVSHGSGDESLGEWNGVALRSKSGLSEDLAPWGAAEEFRDTPLSARCIQLQAAAEALKFEKRSVRLLRLHAASQTCEIRFPDLCMTRGEVRIHIPVITDEDVEIVVANRRVMPRPGEAWSIDFSKPHFIHNRSSNDCIYMVIDGVTNDWAIALLKNAARNAMTETFEPAGVANLRAFREMVFEDAEIQAKLLDITDRRLFIQEVVRVGAQCGYAFYSAEVESALNQSKHDWLMRLVAI